MRRTYSRHVIDVRLINHRRHCLLYASLSEFISAVLIPDGFEVEERTVEVPSKELEGAGVRDTRGTGFVVLMAGENKVQRWYRIV